MEEVFIDIRKENEWIRKHFIDKDFVSINELIGVIEDLDYEVGVLNEKIEDMKEDIKDNYRPVSYWEQYGISEDQFH